MDWFTPTMTLAGVALGALLTPYVTSRMERNKIKRGLKPDLIKAVYTFFNLRKVLTEIANKNSLNNRIADFIWSRLSQRSLETNERGELVRQHEVRNSSSQKSMENINLYYRMILQTESEILSLLAQIQNYYGDKVYNKLNNPIKPHIDRSNSSIYFKDYKELKEREVEEFQPKMLPLIVEKLKELNAQCDKIINKLNSVF